MCDEKLQSARHWMRILAESPLAERLPEPAPCHADPECPCTHEVCSTCGQYDHPFISCNAAGSITHRVLDLYREEVKSLRSAVEGARRVVDEHRGYVSVSESPYANNAITAFADDLDEALGR